jgi:hypothetical protein
MAVLVHERVRGLLALVRGDHHRVAAVAAERLAAAGRAQLLAGDEVDPDRRDLVAVRRRAQDGREPLGVGALDADVEADLAALVVLEEHLRRARLTREGERGDGGEQDQQAAHPAILRR